MEIILSEKLLQLAEQLGIPKEKVAPDKIIWNWSDPNWIDPPIDPRKGVMDKTLHEQFKEIIDRNRMMTDQQAADKIRAMASTGDPETNHAEADELLCELLKELGYKETVAAFDELTRWYA